MERIASADCLDRAAFWNVIDFADLHSRDVTVLGEARWNEPDVSPPIRPRGWNGHLLRFQHQVRFADRPIVRVVEVEGRRHVGRIAA